VLIAREVSVSFKTRGGVSIIFIELGGGEYNFLFFLWCCRCIKFFGTSGCILWAVFPYAHLVRGTPSLFVNIYHFGLCNFLRKKKKSRNTRRVSK